MITCELIGGLGNWLFQSAATVAVALRNDDVAAFDLQRAKSQRSGITYKYTILRNLDTDTDLHQVFMRGITHQERDFGYGPIKHKKNLCLKGFFHTEKYFLDCKEHIKGLFSATDHLKKLLSDWKDVSQCVSVHVRRGDYSRSSMHPILPMDYYNQAFEMFPQTKFLVFSDDLPWCRENFKGDQFEFFDGRDVLCLYLMSMCDHNIIANSSFSWWAAWLNSNVHKIVVAPEKWFENMESIDIPSTDWVVI